MGVKVFGVNGRVLTGQLALIAVLLGAAGRVSAVDVTCKVAGGDSAGWSLATGGDANGDGIDDIVVGAPCAFVGGLDKAGRVLVFSGQDGKRLFSIEGVQAGQRFGAAVAFVDDTDGDGKAELAVGSFGWNATSGGKTIVGAGKFEVFGSSGSTLLTLEGTSNYENFGESIAVPGDVTLDGVPDYVVGAGNARVAGTRRGTAYIVSGADGSIVGVSEGASKFDNWGAVLGVAPDRTQDGVNEIIVSSHLVDRFLTGPATTSTTTSTTVPGTSTTTTTTTIPPLENAGSVRVLSGSSLSTVLEIFGTAEEKLGRSIAAIGSAGLLVGAPGADIGGKNAAGRLVWFDWAGQELRSFSGSAPQVGAALGTAVAVLGDVDLDQVPDVVGGAPAAKVGVLGEAGSVIAFSGATGQPLWPAEAGGQSSGARLGQTLASVRDWDGDGVADVAAGAPGAAPRGRRGAGSVFILSGVDGRVLGSLPGRRGPETRIFAFGRTRRLRATLVSLNHRGRRSGPKRPNLRRVQAGELSVAVLDDTSKPKPGSIRLVLAGGKGAPDDTVLVVEGARRRRIVSAFRGIGGTYTGGANVASGDVIGDSAQELIVAEADSSDGNVRVKVYSPFDVDPVSGRLRWLENSSFQAFRASDVAAGRAIAATGANVAAARIGNGGGKARIVLAPTGGTPVIRVTSSSGAVTAEWVAFFPEDASGVRVAVGDLDGDGQNEILAVPASGRVWVKAFNFDGTPFIPSKGTNPVSFWTLDAAEPGGLHVAVGDVDLDGKGEILISGWPGSNGAVRSFEVDGTETVEWRKPRPFGPVRSGVVLAATDRFLRP